MKDIWSVDTTGLLYSPIDCPIDKWLVCNDAQCTDKSTESWIKIEKSTLIINTLKGIPFI